MRGFRNISCLLIALILSSCARSTRETVPDGVALEGVDTTAEATSTDDSSRRTYIVQSGDTLFSIAWRYELDIRDVIEWNGLLDPDLILVGQSFFLEPARLANAPALDAGAPSDPEDGDIGLDAVARDTGSGVATSPTSTSAQGPVLAIERLPDPAPPGRMSQQDKVPDTSIPVPPPSDSPWVWPVRGPLVSPYGATEETGDGIGIGGDIGADVRATAPGEVVYAGRGLAAYGNLVIVKHDASFLSAYGHNDQLLVEEGDAVAQGQVIAKMGLGPERQPQLHFEIRRNGTPVDPTNYLPK